MPTSVANADAAFRQDSELLESILNRIEILRSSANFWMKDQEANEFLVCFQHVNQDLTRIRSSALRVPSATPAHAATLQYATSFCDAANKAINNAESDALEHDARDDERTETTEHAPVWFGLFWAYFRGFLERMSEMEGPLLLDRMKRERSSVETPSVKNDQWPDSLWLACPDIAKEYQIPEAPLDQRLRRFRAKNVASGGWREDDLASRGARYLYQISAIRSIVEELIEKKAPSGPTKTKVNRRSKK